MLNLKVFILDNKEAQCRFMLNELEKLVGEENVKFCGDPTRAEDVFSRDTYDVAFVDLMLGVGDEEDDAYTGIQIGGSFRAINEACLIVMYSLDIPETSDHFHHYNDCMTAGADFLITRSRLLTFPAAVLEREISEWLKSANARRAGSTKFEYSEDYRTKGLLEVIKEETVEHLVRVCIPGGKLHKIRALVAGFSGNLVLEVKSLESEGGGERSENILKVGRSINALEDELRRRPASGTALEAISKSPADNVGRHRGWSGIAIPAVRNGVALGEWLLGRSKWDRSTEETFLKIVNKALVATAQESRNYGGLDDSVPFKIRYAFASKILDVLNEVSSWKKVVSRRALNAIPVVTKFIEDVLEKRSSWGGVHKRISRLHGDFHSNNVFVTEEGQPEVIDFGRRNYYPRLFDFAALDVDLILGILSSGSGLDYDFDNVSGWEDVAQKQFPFLGSAKRADSGEIVLYARSVLLTEMTGRLEDASAPEYAEAVVFHLLRYLRFDISPPKKALAVIMAKNLIQKHGFSD